jgi:hypothetical protein
MVRVHASHLGLIPFGLLGCLPFGLSPGSGVEPHAAAGVKLKRSERGPVGSSSGRSSGRSSGSSSESAGDASESDRLSESDGEDSLIVENGVPTRPWRQNGVRNPLLRVVDSAWLDSLPTPDALLALLRNTTSETINQAEFQPPEFLTTEVVPADGGGVDAVKLCVPSLFFNHMRGDRWDLFDHVCQADLRDVPEGDGDPDGDLRRRYFWPRSGN